MCRSNILDDKIIFTVFLFFLSFEDILARFHFLAITFVRLRWYSAQTYCYTWELKTVQTCVVPLNMVCFFFYSSACLFACSVHCTCCCNGFSFKWDSMGLILVLISSSIEHEMKCIFTLYFPLRLLKNWHIFIYLYAFGTHTRLLRILTRIICMQLYGTLWWNVSTFRFNSLHSCRGTHFVRWMRYLFRTARMKGDVKCKEKDREFKVKKHKISAHTRKDETERKKKHNKYATLMHAMYST